MYLLLTKFNPSPAHIAAGAAVTYSMVIGGDMWPDVADDKVGVVADPLPLPLHEKTFYRVVGHCAPDFTPIREIDAGGCETITYKING